MTISRRTALAGMLTAGGAAAQVGSTPNGVPVVPLERERLSALALGIRGDNTVADTDRAQRAIEQAARQFRTIHFEGQHEWVFRTSLMLFGSEDYGSSVLRGEGAYSTVIRCSDPTKPVFVNDTSQHDFRRLSIRGLTIRGGSRGLSIKRSGEQVASLLDLEEVRFEFQKEIAVFCDQYLVSCNFDDTVFYYCNRGIYTGRNANNVLFQKCRFEGLNDRVAEFDSPGGAVNGCEDVRFVSCRFEAQNEEPAADAFVIGGYRLSTLTVEGGYFENTHPTILRERGGLGQVVFRNCHFTGQLGAQPGFQREIFDSESIVTLDGNRFVTGSDGARHTLVAGVNRGLGRTRFGSYSEFGRTLRFQGPAKVLTSGVTRFMRVAWAPWSSPEDREGAAIQGELSVSVAPTDRNVGGGIFRFQLSIIADPSGELQGRVWAMPSETAGVRVEISRLEDGSLSLSLAGGGRYEGFRCISSVDAVVAAPVEPPFLLE